MVLGGGGGSGGFAVLREWEPEINRVEGRETGQTSCVWMNLFLFEAELFIYKNSLSWF